MNITQGDTNLIVRYIQAFLQENYNHTLRVSGIYDEYTHDNLIEYMKLPNISSVREVCAHIFEELPELKRLFYCYQNPNEIIFNSKAKNETTRDFIQMPETYNQLNEIVQNLGWNITEYLATDNNNNDRYIIVLNTKNRQNIFPNRDLLAMINLFNNKFVSHFELIDDKNGMGTLHTLQIGINDDATRLVYIPCDENTTYLISHGYPCTVPITIGSYLESIDSVLNGNSVHKVTTTYVSPNNSISYTTEEGAKYLLVQIPFSKYIRNEVSFDMDVLLGDVNLDGMVDEEDYKLLQEFLALPIVGNRNETTRSDLFDSVQVSAANIAHKIDAPTTADITEDDLAVLRDYLDGKIASIWNDNSQTINYRTVTGSYNNSTIRYQNILNISINNAKNDSTVNEFNTSHWAVHSKFIDFLTQHAITPYSDEEDVQIAQQLFDNAQSHYIAHYRNAVNTLRYSINENKKHDIDTTSMEQELESIEAVYNKIISNIHEYENTRYMGIYTDEFKEVIKQYQINNGILFPTGYIDSETEGLLSVDASFDVLE